MNSLILGTRGSALALAQSTIVANALRAVQPALSIEIATVLTAGDRKQGTAAAERGDKKDWIGELERDLLGHTIDFALHSGKDVPLDIEPGTTLIPLLERADPREVLISRSDPAAKSLSALPPEALVGTASLRRQAEILSKRSDARIVPIRGNVPTRVSKLQAGECDFLVLAAAGIQRLQSDVERLHHLSTDEMLPAVNQGILVAQLRSDDTVTAELLRALVHRPTELAFIAEREVVRLLEADCHSAVAIFAEPHPSGLRLRAEVYSRDGSVRLVAESIGSAAVVEELGRAVGRDLLRQGARNLL